MRTTGIVHLLEQKTEYGTKFWETQMVGRRKFSLLAMSLSSHDLALARHDSSLVIPLLSWDKTVYPIGKYYCNNQM